MAQWTREQKQAIDARNHTILVSAAAGSGKTTVLIERIVTLLREGYRMDRMLIVTFTRAAAAEMRQRLQKRLLSEAQLDPVVMGPALDQLEQMEGKHKFFCVEDIRRPYHNENLRERCDVSKVTIHYTRNGAPKEIVLEGAWA